MRHYNQPLKRLLLQPIKSMLYCGKRLMMISGLIGMLSGCSAITQMLPWSDSSKIEPALEVAPTNNQSMPPQIVWQHNLDFIPLGGAKGFSQPALIKLNDGTLAIAAGSGDHFVRILSLATGSELRRIAIQEAVESGTLQLANGIVVVGDITGNLYGIDPNHGTIAWQLHLSTVLLGRPMPLGDDFVLQTMDNRIYRISASGKKLWSFDGYPGGISMHAATSPLVDASNNRVLAVLSTGDLLALDATSGDLLWRKQLLLNANAAVLSEMKAPVAGVVRIADLHYGIDHLKPALLVPLYQGNMRLLDADSGEQRATRALSLRATPLQLNHRLILADSSGTVRAIDTQSGDTLWKSNISKNELTGITVWHKQLWISDSEGQLFRISAAGTMLGKMAIAGTINRAPIPTPAGVIIRSSRGGIYLVH
ncbi:MAG: PQQ-binding-like beta-propeller repeat protein [Mariprofundales bacterium]